MFGLFVPTEHWMARMDLDAEAAPATSEGMIRLFWGRANRPRIRARSGCPVAQQTDPGWPTCRPSGAAQRLGRTRMRYPAQRCHERLPRAAWPTYRPDKHSDKIGCGATHWVSVIRGPSSRRRENGWLSGRLTAGLQDVQSTSTLLDWRDGCHLTEEERSAAERGTPSTNSGGADNPVCLVSPLERTPVWIPMAVEAKTRQMPLSG